ncbi:MAG: translation initiation factor IF-6 [Nitrososphaerota archaeon]|nr:translation initiation factor IF-6 [Nitrososphaerota archaeon]MDG6930245.1 translation initiation factor IF-6 [Nitrososphaerota archaeon]MDG6932631.1 translation initiation factor IF-6 [Nitrososphaerota archaeon]MDG6935577.1 translation initiation factor IF-6 [Nitrososphaerota archaeon]
MQERLSIYLYNMYRNPNVGLFLKASEKALLVPMGYPGHKVKLMEGMLKVPGIEASIGNTRLLGPLMAMNSYGALVTRFATDQELRAIRERVGIQVEIMNSFFTSVGNLILLNDYGGIASDLLSDEDITTASRVFKVKLVRATIAGYHQVGSMGAATNAGALLHPMASDEEIKKVRDALGVEVDVGSVNAGVPFVSSGLVGNSNGLIVGKSTTGPEIMMIGRVFNFKETEKKKSVI